ncbi:MAG: hypothetical protein NUV48_03510 [Peptococcaceae bacterium]|jgi:serpin B|nr:hypothetical protein [Peptococcaceae bacterium]
MNKCQYKEGKENENNKIPGIAADNTINHLNNAGYKENGNRTTLVELVNSLKRQLLENRQYLLWCGFASSGVKEALNRWIEDKTHGRIQNHITNVNPQASMFVFNALCFNGKWQVPFDKSKTQIEQREYRHGGYDECRKANQLL